MPTPPDDRPAPVPQRLLRDIVTQSRHVKYAIPKSGPMPRSGGAPSVFGIYPAVVTTAITAATSDTAPGSGVVQLYYFAADGDTSLTADADADGSGSAEVAVSNYYTNSGTIATGTHVYVGYGAGDCWFLGGDCT